MSSVEPHSRPTAGHIAGQSMLLFSGFGTAQLLSFVRNALIGHALSKGDFGIAAAITIVLQMIEAITDLGSDRLILQAKDGSSPRFLGAAHTLLAMRGLVLGLLLFLLGPALAAAFNAAHAAFAFQAAALSPAIKGFLHLDIRVAQRQFDNRPQMLVEIVPQAVALLLTWPALAISRDYSAVVMLSAAQAAAAVILSHALAEQPYRVAFDRDIFKRQIAFGWPILVSALPLVAVYQGDRLIIAHLSGMENLANYTAAFMVSMVPALIAAKVGHALMLPLFADTLRRGQLLKPSFKSASEAVVILAAVYLAGFMISGEAVLPLIFGAHYDGLGAVVSWLAAMWALRMIQSVPGMALMAHGLTKPFIVAGAVRACAVPVVLAVALHGAPIVTIAAIGCLFEALSLAYVVWRLQAVEHGLGSALAIRTLYIAPAIALAGLAAHTAPGASGAPLPAILAAIAAAGTIAGTGAAVMPSLNALLRRSVESRAARASM